MRILYDSRDTEYKRPFGVLTVGEACTVRVKIPRDVEARFVQLVLEREGDDPALELFFTWAGGDGDYDVFKCEFSLDAKGLYFYWFRITARDGVFRLFKQGRETNMEEGAAGSSAWCRRISPCPRISAAGSCTRFSRTALRGRGRWI